MPARIPSRLFALVLLLVSINLFPTQYATQAHAGELPPPPELGPGYTWALEGDVCAGQWVDDLDGTCAHVDPAPLIPIVDTPEYTADYLRSLYPSLSSSLDPTSQDFLDLAAATRPVYCQDTDVFKGIYVRREGTSNGYGGKVASLRDKLKTVDSYVYASARQRDANMHVRYACNSENNIRVADGGTIPNGEGFDDIKGRLRNRGFNLSTEKYIVFADWAPSSDRCGIGEIYQNDDDPGQTNDNNSGNMFALVWLDSGPCAPGLAAIAMHEMGHTLGAVIENAPQEFDGDGDGHPKDYYDVMTLGYEDLPAAVKKCTNIENRKRWDCKKNNYFHPNPKNTAWLATHWNIANSRFLLRDSAAPGQATLGDDVCSTVANWSGWEGHAGPIAGGLDAASWAPNRLDVFSRSAENKLLHKYWAGAGWSDWLDEQPGPFTPFGNGITSDPSAVSWGSDRIDIFARGADNALWTTAWNGSTWTGWQSLGSPVAVPALGNLPFGITSAPDAASDAAGWIHVFALGSDNAMWTIHRDSGGTWSSWSSLGGGFSSDPSAVASATNRLHVLGRGLDGVMSANYWNGTAWQGWTGIGSYTSSGPDVASWGSNRVDAFAADSSNLLSTSVWDGTQWSGWTSLGGAMTADPGAVSWDANRLDVFVRGTDGLMYHRWWPVYSCVEQPPD